ncbi:PAS domain S-box protein [Methylobacterium sp. J-026]|uniref:hybrid sensor histidine kinase/response regulator n=1 Tax=Methylobacterium sp. J-026 TaxID=2836624 RepID=UPI001FB89409|nr:hybrid sensor histidine kinase/response regulator [Methylobacterium sp. J-026]MCJ2138150.1 PAS domain S-box protein [Methylobacterium sp. J-026]
MGDAIRSHDWSATPLGPVEGWPAALSVALEIMLNSAQSMYLVWGPDLTFLFNDAYRPILGASRGDALGHPLPAVQPDMWAVVRGSVERALTGEATRLVDEPVATQRHEEGATPRSYSFAPVHDGAVVSGVLCLATDATDRVPARGGGPVPPLRTDPASASGAERLEAARAATRASQARLSLAVDIARLGIFEWDTVTGGVEMDARSREIFGLAPDGPVHQDAVFARLEKVDVERAYALTEEARSHGAEVVADYRVTRPDGTTRTIRSSNQPVQENGGHLRMVGVFHDVTGLRQVEADLRALNADLERRVIERTQARGRTWAVAPDLMGALNERGYFETSNPAWGTLLGWSEADIARIPIWDLLHPDDVERTRTNFREVFQDQRLAREANRYRCKDGSYRWISWIGVPEDRLVYCTGRDITVEREREVELAARTAERNLLATIVESTDVMMMACDLDYGILALNRAHADTFERVYGIRPKIGDNLLALLADQPEHLARVRLGWARGLAGEEGTFVEEFGDPRRERPYYEISFRTLRDGNGQRIGCYQFVTDVTERFREQAMLAKTQEHLRQSQKMEAVGQLTGGVAHDFNNLLTVIKSSTDLLKRPNLSDERRARYIGAISDTVDRASRLTGQLLAFARRQALRPEVFDVGLSVQAVADMLGTLMGARIAITTDLPAEACFTHADPSQFDTAMVNMAVNARDAMDGEGRLTIRIEAADGMPGGGPHPAIPGPFVAVSVADTGTGIPAERLEQIFEPFFTTKGVGQGTGLGLSQVFGFAKQSGGEVRVDSEVGGGATFTLYLPRVEGQARLADTGEPEPLVDGHGTRVLVVEDNVAVGTFATQTLAELGYDTVWASDADQALAELGKDADRFDVVFSDVVMPGMDGIELASEIRRRHRDLPVLLASGYSHVLAEKGTSGFELLHKPYSVEALSRALRKVVRRRGAQQPSMAKSPRATPAR